LIGLTFASVVRRRCRLQKRSITAVSHGFRFRLMLRFTPRGEPRALIALASAVTLGSPPWTDDIAQPPVRSKASAEPQTAVFDVGLSV
jgi:hypothetical protein